MTEENSGMSALEDVQRIQTYYDDALKASREHNDIRIRRQEELLNALLRYSSLSGPEGSALRVQLHNFYETNPNGQTQQDITRMLETVKNPKQEYQFTGGILMCSSSDLGLFDFSDRTYTPLLQSNTDGTRMLKAVTERDVDGRFSSVAIYGYYPPLREHTHMNTTGIVRISRDGKKKRKDVSSEILGFFQYQDFAYAYTKRNAASIESLINGATENIPFRFDSALRFFSRPKILSLASTPSGDSLYALSEDDGDMELSSVVLKDGTFRLVNDGFLYDSMNVTIDMKSARIVPDEKGTMLAIEGFSDGPETIPTSSVKRERIDWDKEEDGKFPQRQGIRELVTVLGNTPAVAYINHYQNVYVYRIDTKNPELVDVLPIPANVRASSTLTTITQEHVEALKKMKSEGLLQQEVFV